MQLYNAFFAYSVIISSLISLINTSKFNKIDKNEIINLICKENCNNIEKQGIYSNKENLLIKNIKKSRSYT